jgi:hypothetical protein
MSSNRLNLNRTAALVAMVVGIAAGSYGVASAASGSSSSSVTTTATQPALAAQGGPAAPPGASATTPWGNQRSDETLLTGDAFASVKAAAIAKIGSGATIVRIETDADGHAVYEAHMLKADGTPVTVYVDESFAVVGVETR